MVRESITLHAWRGLAEGPQQPWMGPRTTLYTYVLVGDVSGAAGEGSSEAVTARRALAELLAEIGGGQAVDAQAEAVVLRRTNQFLIPSTRAPDVPVMLQAYDFRLAAAYRARARIAFDGDPIGRRLDGPGPFLLAMAGPWPEALKSEASGRVLLMDLSGHHPKAMPVFVTAFRDAVRDAARLDDQVLEPLRPRLASALLRTSEALPFVAEAYAGTRKLIEPGARP